MNTPRVENDLSKIRSNVVTKGKLREVQKNTLHILKDTISKTFGPAGSNTLILHGDNKGNLVAEYSKDGHKVLKNVSFDNVIEMSIQSECTEITRYVEKKVGDGTSSAVILSSLIFDELCDMEDTNNPYQVIRDFKVAIEDIKEEIMTKKRDITLQDIYDIAMISTNGNGDIASRLLTIYEEHGFDVYIDVNISNDTNNYIREYDGLTLEKGFCDPVFINTMSEGVSRIRNAHIYAFVDPIDTQEMIGMFETIINNNIFVPYANKEPYIPTVIMAPKISRDMSALMTKLVNFLYQFNQQKMESQKPPICVITNINVEIERYLDIAKLSGAPEIHKYIDPKVQEKDVEMGLAPTLETICDFCGIVEEVVSDSNSSKFINPIEMYTDEVDEDGNLVRSNTYNALLAFLESELRVAQESGREAMTVGNLKRRINSLKANMVDYLVGGVTISDRDSLRDLVEDAVLNCRSAALNGVGYAANFEGKRASAILLGKDPENVYYDIIDEAYESILVLLYSTICTDIDEVGSIIYSSLKNGCPMNIANGEYDHKVLTSINTDIIILDAISKIVTIMFTANQAIVQVPALNIYEPLI